MRPNGQSRNLELERPRVNKDRNKRKGKKQNNEKRGRTNHNHNGLPQHGTWFCQKVKNIPNCDFSIIKLAFLSFIQTGNWSKISYLIQNSATSCIDINTNIRILSFRNCIFSWEFGNSHFEKSNFLLQASYTISKKKKTIENRQIKNQCYFDQFYKSLLRFIDFGNLIFLFTEKKWKKNYFKKMLSHVI